jgi:hypothetical protein
VLADFGLQRALLDIAYDLGTDLAANRLIAPFKDSEDCRFILAARACDPLRPLFGMHVAGLAADVGFVRFNLRRSLSSVASRKPSRIANSR